MDLQEKQLLEQNLEVSKETNHLLKKVVSAQRWGRVFRIFYWAIIIGGSIGVYYWLQPVMNQVLGNYDAIMKGLDSVQQKTQSLPDSSALNSFLDKFRQGQ